MSAANLNPGLAQAMNNNPVQANQPLTYDQMADQMEISQFQSWANAGGVTRRLEINTGNNLAQNEALHDLVAGNRSKESIKTANNNARQVFLRLILRECGVTNTKALPKAVRDAMKLNSGNLFRRLDWNEGRGCPLSARRIREVSDAVNAYKEQVNAIARESRVAMENEDWFGSAEHGAAHKAFWCGLDQGLRAKILTPNSNGAKLFARLWANYVATQGANPEETAQMRQAFLRDVNSTYVSGKKMKNPIPLGVFSTGTADELKVADDSVGKCIKSMIDNNSYSIGTMDAVMWTDSHGTQHAIDKGSLHYALIPFDNEKCRCTFTYQVVGSNGLPEDRTLILKGGGDLYGGSLVVEERGKTLNKVHRIVCEKTAQSLAKDWTFNDLNDKLKEVTGLTSKELCVLMSRMSTRGFSHNDDTLSSKKNCFALFAKEHGIGASKGIIKADFNTFETKVEVRHARNLNFHLTVSGRIGSYETPDGEIRYDYRLPGAADQKKPMNAHSLIVDCNYVLPPDTKNLGDTHAQKPQIQDLKYAMSMNMRKIGSLSNRRYAMDE